ncbi:SH3 domain-containing protein [Psychrilyobacter atlanticus]|uniref:SH3 domain-containing protein n=1 Tax=Psychrilyobacter atlanticus TaxID=271091 RepID=UPI00041E8B3B|nr:SH3 domain-containing protein [Psychrilyobacter atlanticus]
MNKYLVEKGRESEFPNPIKVLKGEKVKCIEESNENGDWKGWIFCKTINNEGWIPQQIIDQNNDKGIILENYDATEFNLEMGEILVEEKALNGWIWGYKEKEPQKKGWAPLNHIEILK